jgi:hypothetical protein
MMLFGVMETAVSAWSSPLAGAGPVEFCPPEMTMCPMHAGEPCCCGPDSARESAETGGLRFGAGCVGAPAPVPVVFPVSPLFRFLAPEDVLLEAPHLMPAAWSSPIGVELPSLGEPPTPPPQSDLI